MNNFDYKKIGERLRKLRNYLGLTQEQVANILNLGRDAIIRIEKGEKKIDLQELINFTKLYNISLDELTAEKHITFDNEVAFARGFNELSPKDKKEIIKLIEYKNLLKIKNTMDRHLFVGEIEILNNEILKLINGEETNIYLE